MTQELAQKMAILVFGGGKKKKVSDLYWFLKELFDFKNRRAMAAVISTKIK